MSSRFLIVGAGFSGAVLAHRLAELIPGCMINVWEEKPHIAGNCFTERDERTGVMVHKYGPHIFNTDNKEIWDFVNRFIQLRPFAHKVKATYNGVVYTLPVTLHTINQFFGKAFSPAEAKEFVRSKTSTFANPANFEEQALSMIGPELYKAFFYGYTKKQWGCEPTELPATNLKRLPLRFNYNDVYYAHEHIGIPEEGYTPLVHQLLNRNNIELSLNKKFTPGEDLTAYDHVFFTGPIDYFFNYKLGRLSYRTITFETIYSEGDYQGTAVMNYCDPEIPYTRITEHKHFTPWEKHESTICFKEFSKETAEHDIPFYPKRLAADKQLLKNYRAEALKQKNVSFLGRLGTYRYMDMHHVIGESLKFAETFAACFENKTTKPAFPNTEE